MADVVVIGAGMAGLATAARLATVGHRVTVLEQAATIGGKLGSFSRDGFVFDTGPSLLTLPATYRDLFKKTGKPLEKVLDLVAVDPVAHYRFGDGIELDMPNVSTARIAKAWDDALGAGAGADWTALLERAAKVWDLTREPFLESPLQGIRTLLGLARNPRDVVTVAPATTLRGLGAKYLKHPHQRTFLDRYATYTGSDPRQAPAALVTVPFVEQRFGAWYVPGGLRVLGEAVHRRALERGVVVRTQTLVESISVGANGAVDGVRLAGGEIVRADVVVANADAAQVYSTLLPGPEGRPGRRRLGRATPSLSGFVLLLALRGRTPGLRHHTVLFPADYDAEFDAVFGRRSPGRGSSGQRGFGPVDDPTVYISAPDDAALRPDDGHESWFVLVNAPRQSSDPATGFDWTAAGVAEKYADRVLAVMAERGLDVRDRLVWKEIRTPADLERNTLSPGGSIYGSSSNGTRAAFLRPANRSDVTGLFLVGGSSHPGGGLPLVALSAAIVATQIGPA